VQTFGKEAVFRDIDNIPVGIDFRERMGSVLRESDILLVIVGPRWLGRARSGRARIDDPTDLVRIEVETALETGLPIIPILVGNARMPDVERLPESLQPFAFRNVISVDSGQDFDHHIQRLIRVIQGTLSSATTSADQPTNPSTTPRRVFLGIRDEYW
jgi:hypothetical protein